MLLNRRVLLMAALGPLSSLVIIVVMRSGAVPAYQSYSVALAAVYTILVMAVCLLAGWSGVFSVGHPAFFAIGAYCVAYGSAQGWSLELTILLAVAVSAGIGAFLGFAGARFSVLYIALLTLAFTLVTLEIINRWSSVTGGDQGVPVTSLSSSLGLGTVASGSTAALYLAVVAAGLTSTVAVLTRQTGLRMRLVAAKSHPIAARSVGIAPELQTALAFAVSAAFAGLAGCLLGLITGFVSPDTFSLNLGIVTIGASVLGGVGTIMGSVVGGVYMTWIPTLADSIGVPQPIVQGVLLIAMLILLPGGVVPYLGRLLRGGWSRLRPSGPASTFGLQRETGATLLPGADARDESSTPGQLVARGKGTSEVLSVANLRVRFGGLNALEGANLSVRGGEVLAIIGPNGAGKTTLVNVLSGLVGGGKIEGSVRYGSHDLLHGRATSRRALGIGRTFQHAEPFGELTVLENVMCTHRWPSAAHTQRAKAVLASVGLQEFADRLPPELPFGLQKRLDLARAISEDPQLLILDEPFGGLDATERAATARRITSLRDSGVGVVVIDHVIDDLFAVADRVVAFDFGRPVGEGAPDVVLKDPAVRASYLGTAGAVTAPAKPAGEPALAVRVSKVEHRYGGVIALDGVDLEVGVGTLVGLVGANGAGKSTLGQILHGSMRPTHGSREVGVVGGRQLRSSLVPEGRALFKTLSLRENLEVAAFAAGIRGKSLQERLDQTAEWLPQRLRDRLAVPAAALSGGEQQLLAIARALMADPDVIILDEPALGLAPTMVDEVYGRIAELVEHGVTVVILEQLLSRALGVCQEVLVLHEGVVAARGRPGDRAFADEAEAAYFGGALARAGMRILEV